MHPQFHAGDVCTSSAGVADIFKRRLLALCSDSMKSRKFLPDKNLATIDVLRDIDYPSCAYFGTSFAYMRNTHTRTLTIVARSIFIFGVGFALSFYQERQCESVIEWNGNSRTPRFFLYALTITTIRIVGGSYATKT